MTAPYIVTLDVDGDLYDEWKAYLVQEGIRARGTGAAIRDANNRVFEDAIKKKMKKSNL